MVLLLGNCIQTTQCTCLVPRCLHLNVKLCAREDRKEKMDDFIFFLLPVVPWESPPVTRARFMLAFVRGKSAKIKAPKEEVDPILDPMTGASVHGADVFLWRVSFFTSSSICAWFLSFYDVIYSRNVPQFFSDSSLCMWVFFFSFLCLFVCLFFTLFSTSAFMKQPL